MHSQIETIPNFEIQQACLYLGEVEDIVFADSLHVLPLLFIQLTV